MTAPLEHMARYYELRGYEETANGLMQLADRGREAGMPRDFVGMPIIPELSDEDREKISRGIRDEFRVRGISSKTGNPIIRNVLYAHQNPKETPLRVFTATDLHQIPDKELLQVKLFGPRTLKELRTHFPYTPPETEIYRAPKIK
jgi:hypothetical protein